MGEFKAPNFWPCGITDQQQNFLWHLAVHHINKGIVTAWRIDIGINQIEASLYSPFPKWIGYFIYKNITFAYTLIFVERSSRSSQSVYNVLDQAITISSSDIEDITISSIDIFSPAGYSNVFKVQTVVGQG